MVRSPGGMGVRERREGTGTDGEGEAFRAWHLLLPPSPRGRKPVLQEPVRPYQPSQAVRPDRLLLQHQLPLVLQPQDPPQLL